MWDTSAIAADRCLGKHSKKPTLKRRAGDETDADYYHDNTWFENQRRIRGTVGFEPLKRSLPKRLRMSPMGGLPTQFHGVPLEERAIDSKGSRMPWSLEWHE